MRLMLLGLVALVAVGCGSDETVHVGAPGQKGIIRNDIDKSRSVAQQASDQVHQGEQALNGS